MSNPTNNSNSGTPASSTLQPMRSTPISRSITPDVSMTSFPSLQPTSNASISTPNAWGSSAPAHSTNLPLQPQTKAPANTPNSFFLPPPPSNPWRSQSSIASPPLAHPPSMTPHSTWQMPEYGRLSNNSSGAFAATMPALTPSTNQPQQQAKEGLDKYQSLL